MKNRFETCAGCAGRGRDACWLGCRRRERLLFLTALFPAALVLALGVAGLRSPPVLAAEPAPPAAAAFPVEEWLNQIVRLRETVQATSLPVADSKPSGEIRAGAEVRAIGLVAGKHWVQIELPDRSRAYVPREAIEYESAGAAASPPAAGQHLAASPSAPAPTAAGPPGPTAARPSATPSSAPATLSAAPGPTAAGAIHGTVARVPNAATLIVGDQRVRLSGIDPGPIEVLGPFESWVKAQGDLSCEPDAQTGRYHCLTSSGVDVAEAAILNGAGRVGDGAAPEYRDSETQARNARRGLWQGL